MELPPAGAVWLVDADRLLQLPHPGLVRMFRELHPHLEGAYFPLAEEIKPDGACIEEELLKIRLQADAQFQNGVVVFSSGMEDMKAILHDLAHQQACTVLGNVNDTTCKRASNENIVLHVDYQYLQGEVIAQTW